MQDCDIDMGYVQRRYLMWLYLSGMNCISVSILPFDQTVLPGLLFLGVEDGIKSQGAAHLR